MPTGFVTDDQARERRALRRRAHPRPARPPFPPRRRRPRLCRPKHRGEHNRLGVAIQLGAVWQGGAFVDDFAEVPASAARYAADQIDVADHADALVVYSTSEGRWRHGVRIRERYGYRQLTDAGVAFRLHRFLFAFCWTGINRPSTLFDRAVAWLLAAKVLLPGLSVLERVVARVRARAADRLFRRLAATLTLEQRERLDALVAVPEDVRRSSLDRLRDGPFIRSGPEIGRAVRRLEEIRAIGCGLPEIDRLPPAKVTALARFASAARARGRWRGCPTTGARRRCWPWCARWRPRPPTT